MSQQIYSWKGSPFLRLLLPFIAGITINYYYALPFFLLVVLLATTVGTVAGFSFLSLKTGFSHRWVNGIMINLLLLCSGGLLLHRQDISREENWIGNQYNGNAKLLVSLVEPLSEKPKTYKAEATIIGMIRNDSLLAARGNIILYLRKETHKPSLDYGSVICFDKTLQNVRGTGNPGAFDYREYCLMHDISHQVFLAPGEYSMLNNWHGNAFTRWIFESRDALLSILRKNITEPRERGIAEALLIGYRDELDKDLVQSYSNTGVVHIIAISGLHLGMIYAALLFILRPFDKKRKLRWIKPVIIIVVLWLFSLMAGAAPSVLRAAVMFSFICIGDLFNKQSNIINSLAASAFCLLCYNPFYLWDVGFQLSYAAVLSIILFMNPLRKWFCFPNIFLSKLWDMCAVTVSAQVLTFPFIIYHFHQFPAFFLLSNMVVVPLSSFILFAEIVLCIVAPISTLASLIGRFVTISTCWMNNFIEWMDHFRFSVIDAIHISLFQFFVLLAFIGFFSYWLISKEKKTLFTSCCCMIIFLLARNISLYHSSMQQKLIIYNIPGSSAMDIINGRVVCFYGDEKIIENPSLFNFNIKPSRILHQVSVVGERVCSGHNTAVYKAGDHFVLQPGDNDFPVIPRKKLSIRVLLLSSNTKSPLERLSAIFDIGEVVIDGSNSRRQAEQWKNDCARLSLGCHSVITDGAFTLDCR